MDPIALITRPDFVDAFVIPWSLRIITAIAIWLIGQWVANRITRLVRRGMERAAIDITLVRFLGNIIHTALLVVIIIAALDHLGVPTTSMLAVFGAAGLAIGLALRDSLANFASGIMLILFRPFRVGDFVEAGSVSGSVEEIRIFSTMVRTADNRVIIVPNGQIANAAIINHSALPTRRIDLVIGVSYEDRLDHVRAVLERIIAAEPRILADPAPQIVVGELAESSVNVFVRPWVNTGDFWPVRFDLLETIKRTFDEEGITIPFPQRQVIMRQG